MIKQTYSFNVHNTLSSQVPHVPMSQMTGSYGCNIMPRLRTTPNLLDCVSDVPGKNMNNAFGTFPVATLGSFTDSVEGNNNMASAT